MNEVRQAAASVTCALGLMTWMLTDSFIRGAVVGGVPALLVAVIALVQRGMGRTAPEWEWDENEQTMKKKRGETS